MILDNENSPATMNWRQDRLAVWQKIIDQRNADYALAAKHTSPGAAAKYADERVRATVRTFVAEVLRRAPQTAAVDFLTNAPPDWAVKTEALLGADELVPRLIRRSYPFPTWAAELNELQKKKAEIDSDWGSWLSFYTGKLSQEVGIGLDSAGKAVSGVGSTLEDFGSGVVGFFNSTGQIMKWGAIAVGGVLVIMLLRR